MTERSIRATTGASTPPIILHADIDAFFASVEQRDDPRLRGRPVAVGSGVAASCSYEARRWGVRTGMRLSEARHLCPRLLVLPGDYRRYEQAARRVLAICLERSPLVEMGALDDLYLDLTGRDRPENQAGELRAQVREEVGLSLSAGIAVNKLVARVATRQAKPGRQVIVPAGTEQTYLAPWPVRVLHGVGPGTFQRLERLNVRQVGEVAAMPLPVLRGLFGDRGRVLHAQAHGIDPRPVVPQRLPQSVSRCTSFDPPAAEPAFLQGMLDYLLERALTWLRFHHRAARGITLSIRYGDYAGARGRTALRTPTADERTLKEAARDRFARVYQRRLPLRLVGLELSPLVAAEAQASLFPDPEVERAGRLAECKDAIRHRFGFMSLVSGASLAVAGQVERDREGFRLRTPCLTR